MSRGCTHIHNQMDTFMKSERKIEIVADLEAYLENIIKMIFKNNAQQGKFEIEFNEVSFTRLSKVFRSIGMKAIGLSTIESVVKVYFNLDESYCSEIENNTIRNLKISLIATSNDFRKRIEESDYEDDWYATLNSSNRDSLFALKDDELELISDNIKAVVQTHIMRL